MGKIITLPEYHALCGGVDFPTLSDRINIIPIPLVLPIAPPFTIAAMCCNLDTGTGLDAIWNLQTGTSNNNYALRLRRHPSTASNRYVNAYLNGTSVNGTSGTDGTNPNVDVWNLVGMSVSEHDGAGSHLILWGNGILDVSDETYTLDTTSDRIGVNTAAFDSGSALAARYIAVWDRDLTYSECQQLAWGTHPLYLAQEACVALITWPHGPLRPIDVGPHHLDLSDNVVGTPVADTPQGITPGPWPTTFYKLPISFVPDAGGPTTHTASGSPDLPLIIAAGVAEVVKTADGAADLPQLQAAGVAEVVKTADGATELPKLLSDGTAQVGTDKTASGAPILPALEADGVAEVVKPASGAPVLPMLTAAGIAEVVKIATGAPTLPSLQGAGVAIRVLTANAATELPKLLGIGTADIDTDKTANGAPTLPMLTAAGIASGPSGPAATGGWRSVWTDL